MEAVGHEGSCVAHDICPALIVADRLDTSPVRVLAEHQVEVDEVEEVCEVVSKRVEQRLDDGPFEVECPCCGAVREHDINVCFPPGQFSPGRDDHVGTGS